MAIPPDMPNYSVSLHTRVIFICYIASRIGQDIGANLGVDTWVPDFQDDGYKYLSAYRRSRAVDHGSCHGIITVYCLLILILVLYS